MTSRTAIFSDTNSKAEAAAYNSGHNTNNMTKKEYRKVWREIGSAPVDSGQLMIVDPCYLKDWKDGDFELEKEKGDNDYDAVCRVTCGAESAGETFGGSAVAFSSGYGDGCYPVYAYYNEDGRITEIKIKMA